MFKEAKLEELLRRQELRFTRPRRVVYEFLALAQEPMTLAQIVSALTGIVDRSSIYRILGLYKKLGVVREVNRPGQHRFELGEDFNHHHHHITCVDCGLSRTITSPALEQQLAELARQARFSGVFDHQVELAGRCQDCLGTSRDQQVIEESGHR